MSISARRKENEERKEALLTAKLKRAKDAADVIIKSDQFKLSALSMPESRMAIDSIVTATVIAITDSSGNFLDVMTAKGFRQAEIRKMVHNLYNTYCAGFADGSDEIKTYEYMLPKVADYLYSHQEIYNALDPNDLRN